MDRFEYSAPTMGTMLKIVLYAPSESMAQRWISICLDEIERLIPVLNNYSPQSEISKLNADAGRSMKVSEDLYRILEQSHRWYQLSDGAFDVTCGRLFLMWKEARNTGRLPAQEHRRAVQELCGWQHVQLSKPRSAKDQASAFEVTLKQPGLVLDLSGIATGFIIDSAVDKMQSDGCSRYLIDIGGDIRLGDPPEGRVGWIVQVEGLSKENPPMMHLALSNCSLTTSGDRNQSSRIDGKNYSHLVDPRTGMPLQEHQSTTVVADRAIDADAGATALSVLGRRDSAGRIDRMPIDQAILLYAGLAGETAEESVVGYTRLVREKTPQGRRP
jgi:thiamine biosynthesis lipoprotein